MSDVADSACRDAFRGWQPSLPPPTHREFCPRTRLPGGPLKGTPYDPSTDPVQSWLIDQLDSGRWARIYWSAPPQVAGKSQCAIIVPAMRAALLPGPLRPGNAYLRHLTAVGWSTTPAGRRIWGPIKGSGRWDYFDARAYSTAVALALRVTDETPPAEAPSAPDAFNDPFLRRLR